MIKKWWWKRTAKTRRLFLIGAQIVFMVGLAILLGRAVVEAVKNDPDIVTLNMLVLAFVAQLALAGFVLSRKKRLPWYWKEFADLRPSYRTLNRSSG